jgi:hypothetical protein
VNHLLLLHLLPPKLKRTKPMEISSVVIDHGFDEGMLEQIQALRTIRLDMAEKMLLDLGKTSDELKNRGLIDREEKLSADDLRTEILSRITTLKSRMGRPEVVFSDEISLFVDLLEADALAGEEDNIHLQ